MQCKLAILLLLPLITIGCGGSEVNDTPSEAGPTTITAEGNVRDVSEQTLAQQNESPPNSESKLTTPIDPEDENLSNEGIASSEEIEAPPTLIIDDPTYQYVGVVNSFVTPNYFYSSGQFIQLSEKITEQTLLDYFNEYLDTCYIDVIHQEKHNIYLPQINSSSIFHSALMDGDVRSIETDNNYASALKTPVSAGRISFFQDDIEIPIQTPYPNADLKYNTNAYVGDNAVIGKSISMHIDGEYFPSFSGVVAPIIEDHGLNYIAEPSDDNRLYKWNTTIADAALTYVELSMANADIKIQCRLHNDGVFEVPESLVDELLSTSILAHNHFQRGMFETQMRLRKIGIHRNSDALLITNSYHNQNTHSTEIKISQQPDSLEEISDGKDNDSALPSGWEERIREALSILPEECTPAMAYTPYNNCTVAGGTFFDYKSDQLIDASLFMLNEIVDQALMTPDSFIEIHTHPEIGDDALNMRLDLAINRASATAEYLVLAGFPRSQLAIHITDETHPTYPADNYKGRILNGFVGIHILDGIIYIPPPIGYIEDK